MLRESPRSIIITCIGILLPLWACAQNPDAGAGSLDELFTQTNPANFFSGATDIIWDGAQFVALTGQSVAVSPDGQNWETHSIGLNAVFERIAYGNGTYVLVGESDVVATSSDLEDFTLRSSGLGLPAFNFADVTFFNGRFYAANINNAYISSVDGAGWTSESSPFSLTQLGGVGRLDVLNGELVISWQQAGAFTDIVFYTSTNGTDFTGPSASVNVGHETLAQAFGNGVYLSAATGGIARSTDGSNWTRVDGLPATTARSLAFVDGRFVANFLNDRWYFSDDGLTWTAAVGEETEAAAIATDGAVAVGVGDEPFWTTDRGANWSTAVVDQLPLPDEFFNADFAVTAGNGRFLFTMPSAPSFVSSDARTFTATGQRLGNAAYGNGVFVGYDYEDARLEYSLDGLEWFAVPIPDGAENSLNAEGGVVFTGDHFFRPGWTSSNGIDWSELPGFTAPGLTGGRPGLVDRLTGAVASPDTEEFWLRGFTETFWFSPDGGQTFDSRRFGLREYPHVAYGNGIWVLAGPNGYYRVGDSLASTTEFRYEDGVERPGFLSLSFIDGIFYATIEDNRILISVDGRNWTQKTFETNVTLVDGAFDGRLGVLTGREATVLVADLGEGASPPAISAQPEGSNLDEGGDLQLSATVSNAGGATYLWTLNGRPLENRDNIAGADTPDLTITSIRADQAGDYRLIVRTGAGGTISQVAEVTINPLPVFTADPQSVTVLSGQAATLTAAVDDPAATLQWRRNGVDLSGETSDTLTLTSVTAADAAIYTVVASNDAGSRSSAPASVSVNVRSGGAYAPDASFMANVPGIFDGVTIGALAVQPDGKILVGASYDDGSGFGPHLHRLNADGSLDASFNPPDLANGEVRAIAVDDQGRIFAGGTHRNPMALLVLDANGSVIKEFDTTGPRFAVFDLVIDDGRLHVVGDFVLFEGEAATGVTRINLADLSVDEAYQANAAELSAGLFYDGAVQSDGKLVVMGQVSFRTFVRLNQDGTEDNSFANPFISTRDLFAVDGQDNLHLGRVKYGPNGDEIDSFRSPGEALKYLGDDILLAFSDRPIAVSALDGSDVGEPDFGSEPAGPFASRANRVVQAGDDFLFAGRFDSFLGAPANSIARLTAGGAGGGPLTIARQPANATARPGERAVFAVAASGNGLSFQWRKDGEDLTGETATALTITEVEADDAGAYQVVISDGDGNTLISEAATLTVPGASPIAQSFAGWAAENLPGAAATLNGDANQNGVPDGFDYILSASDNPAQALPQARVQRGSLIGAGNDQKYMTFEIRQPRDLTGLTITPKAASSLEDLANGAQNVVMTRSEPNGNVDVITYRTTFSIDDASQAFMIIEIQETP